MKVGIMGLGALGSTLAKRILMEMKSDSPVSPLQSIRLLLWNRSTMVPTLLENAPGTTMCEDPAAMLLERPDWLFLTLPDDHLSARVHQLLADLDDWSGMGVIHTSGWLASDILNPMKERGAGIASMHPIQTFTRDSDPWIFKGIHVSLEGDPDLCERLEAFVRQSLEAIPFRTDPYRKQLLHAAAVLSSNAIVPALAASRDLLAEHEFPVGSEMLKPLISNTISNVDRLGGMALSGPVRRGDLATVEAHLKLLSNDPSRLRRYALLSLAMLDTIPDDLMGAETREDLTSRLLHALGLGPS